MEIAARYPLVYAAVGIRRTAPPPQVAAIGTGSSNWPAARVVALGETGLDRHWDYTLFDVQQDYFDRHLRLAAAAWPVIVHCREAEADVLAMLLGEAARRGPLRVIHAFSAATGSLPNRAWTLGMYISSGGGGHLQEQEVRGPA